MPVWLIAVGDELLEGRTADTNSRSVQRALGIHAVSVRGIQVVHDTVEDIVAALNRTGAGLVVASNPEAELSETRLKLRTLLSQLTEI